MQSTGNCHRRVCFVYLRLSDRGTSSPACQFTLDLDGSREWGTVSNQERFLARRKVRRYPIETEKLGALRFATFWKKLL